VRGENTPQHVQNLVIRDYAARNGFAYRLSATEYAMPGCFMMLETAVRALDHTDGIIFFSLFMMPPDPGERRKVYARALQLNRTLCFALENLSFGNEQDIDRLEDMFSVERFALGELSPTQFDPEAQCTICGGAPVSETAVSFSGVTSDVKPWPRLSGLLICADCGLLHKRRSSEWFEDIASIYADYEAYHQGGGSEQTVRNEESAALSPRSTLLVRFTKAHQALPERGRLLDVGCGNGAFLRAYAVQFPNWELVGADHSTAGEKAVRAIPGVTDFVAGGPAEVHGHFDLISLVHVLEHVPDPISFLREVDARLRPGGVVLISAPDFTANPFDLVVADHVSHYSFATLSELVERGGFRLAAYDRTTVRKEHLALLTKADPGEQPVYEHTTANAAPTIDFLGTLATWLSTHFDGQSIGILGTGIAATWAHGRLGQAASFFVDEDPNRAGQSYLGLPVLPPSEVQNGATVFVAQPPAIAAEIVHRLAEEASHVTWVPCPSPDELGS
jgi:sporadic carbohydrate cluster protein (TIGR04323 family)